MLIMIGMVVFYGKEKAVYIEHQCGIQNCSMYAVVQSMEALILYSQGLGYIIYLYVIDCS